MIGVILAGAAAIAGFLLLTRSRARTRLRGLVGGGARTESAALSGGGAQTGERTESGGADAQLEDPHRAIAVIDRAAALLRIGLPPATVTIQLAEVSDADLAAVLTRVSRSMSLGDNPGVAFARHADTLPGRLEQVLTGMGAVWAVAESAGAPAADVLERYARSRREIAEAER